ncbi:aminoglycoside 6-adenylyltransferase [Ornithinibacillus bavariensis]|uniref:Aminoglycoside 6-adenylyltransferase n=1 Tax=Ornithinibacillus bavariensis TaxID=545502 RepID=A0A920C694_9BACI|nr:aminoglycoside 6-adenylyltransferase [Ornithinibacillus bavariensis]GIO25899.1 aminoglycoside 6-adenylyltransferase [Ornithinibacillus bavariensis]
MRTEKEMLDLILDVAKNDERIRAVYMNGSRTNPNVPKDIFQDFDIVYVVKETEPFIHNAPWISVFGELLMVQEPEKMDKEIGETVDLSQNYGYLMLFSDGNRIDLHIQTKDYMLRTYKGDSLTMPLLDKDDCLPPIPNASDKDYWITMPIEAEYFSACNDFWWCTQNVAKGIWREELPYAKEMFEAAIRPRINQLVSWWIGIQHDFQISPGKMGKYFENYLPKPYWDMYRSTYANGEYEETWEALFVACELFRLIAIEVSESLSFKYLYEEDRNMTRYLKRVRELPKEAVDIF